MDNVRRLSDLVAGNVEHLNVLAGYTEVARPSSLTSKPLQVPPLEAHYRISLRSRAQLDQGYDDVVAMKKRYLQIRVERAAQRKASACDEERRQALLGERTWKLSAIEQLERHISSLELELQDRRQQAIAFASLDEIQAIVRSCLDAAEKELEGRLEMDSLISSNESRGEVSASLVAAMKNLQSAVTQAYRIGGTDVSLAMPLTPPQSSLAEILESIQIILRSMKQSADVHSTDASHYRSRHSADEHKHIQRVVLDVARALYQLREECQQEAETIIASLQAIPLAVDALEDDRPLDLSAMEAVKASETLAQEAGNNLAAHIGEAYAQLGRLCNDLASSAASLGSIFQACREKIRLGAGKRDAGDLGHGPDVQRLLAEVAQRHVLAPAVPDMDLVRSHIAAHDQHLTQRMQDITQNAMQIYETFLQQAANFTKECLALERLEERESSLPSQQIN